MTDSPLPQQLNIKRAEEILTLLAPHDDLAERIQFCSAQFLGCNYLADPLIGSPNQDEVFICSLDGFDCVTYVETVLAFSLARSVEEFSTRLQQIRYSDEVTWMSRNHYMVDWVHSNEAQGIVEDLTSSLACRKLTRTLSRLESYPPHTCSWQMTDPVQLIEQPDIVTNGDVVFFGSMDDDLDIFHLGFLVKKDNELLLRHASRDLGGVRDESFTEFLKRNTLSGIVLVRPNTPDLPPTSPPK